MTPRRTTRLLLWLGLICTPLAQAVEILRWDRLPLAVPLVVGQERVIFIDRNVRVGVPISVAEKLRVQSAGGAVYLRASEVFTPLNDVEHSFAQAEHLKEVFNELAPELIDAAIVDVTAFKRDEFVNAARVAREQVSSSLYDVPRKRKKPEWAESGMPDKAPPVHAFVPANGLTPVSFQHSHGKMLMDGLRPKIHHHVGGASQASDSRIYTPTEHLLTPTWREAFDPQ
ncbi:hypothetical protein APB30_11035 [Pseudomonas aeruginosa]|nr:DUF3438 family protein [Pseudomonas aeruginosa]AHB57786.1 hypothetical protein U769_22775 [Pseudomonas aeruginosa MTB-1]KSK69523.1 hypothetical protein APA36_22200 [Pseudomonas aeruginosa]KSQ41112.1 hypothetical protein APB30_11035 [Pseudomonas aeruginosa]OHQ44244.1 hypothetical protein HMPREF2615_28720 [Pseudomonas aeruginosa]